MIRPTLLALSLGLSLGAAQASTVNYYAKVGAYAAGNGTGTVYAGGVRHRDALISRRSPEGNLAWAEADLSDGALHATAYSVPQPSSCIRGVDERTCIHSSARSHAHFYDVVTFKASELRDPGLVRWRFDIHGDEDDGPLAGQGSDATAKFAYHVGLTAPNYNSYMNIVHNGDRFAGSFAMPSDPDETLTLHVWAQISVDAHWGGWAQYGNTARFNWELPPGVSYTSASGVFMSDHPLPAVPEPQTWLLASMGLLALRQTLRQRHVVEASC
ncbi:MAG: hypothetical protein ACK4F7_08020 [Inhella sp.]